MYQSKLTKIRVRRNEEREKDERATSGVVVNTVTTAFISHSDMSLPLRSSRSNARQQSRSWGCVDALSLRLVSVKSVFVVSCCVVLLPLFGVLILGSLTPSHNDGPATVKEMSRRQTQPHAIPSSSRFGRAEGDFRKGFGADGETKGLDVYLASFIERLHLKWHRTERGEPREVDEKGRVLSEADANGGDNALSLSRSPSLSTTSTEALALWGDDGGASGLHDGKRRRASHADDFAMPSPFAPRELGRSLLADEASIYVSLSSFRDRFCSTTMLSLFSQARNPDRLRVTVIQQHDEVRREKKKEQKRKGKKKEKKKKEKK